MGVLITTFAALGVPESICTSLAQHGIVDAFPIQEMTLPLALTGKDLIGQAKTGTGKTFAFGIPLLAQLTTPASANWQSFAHAGKPQALVIVPTRELAIQVAKDLEQAGAHMQARVICLYGGKAYEPQIEALQSGVEVVVGTPGRLIDLVQQKHLDLSKINTLVMDEADEMLDMGFLPDVETLVSKTSADRQTMLFSATMPSQIVTLARRYMRQPTHIRATDPNSETSTVDAIEQHVWRAHNMDKPELVARILQAEQRGRTIIFCRTKRVAGTLETDLQDRGFSVRAVHGDLGQGAREQALTAFRSGKADVLVATDVAARGIDIADVTHVINYECPEDDKTYVHRIGRTGRAGSSGVAITLIDWQDLARWQMINRTLGLAFHEPIETYSSSDHVYTGLNIPKGIKGRIKPATSVAKEKPATKKSSAGKKPKHNEQQTQKQQTQQREHTKRPSGEQRARKRTRRSDSGQTSQS